MLNEEDYDYKTDAYSFGVVLYFVFVGSLLKQNLKDQMAGNKVQLPEPSESISKLRRQYTIKTAVYFDFFCLRISSSCSFIIDSYLLRISLNLMFF